MTKLSLFFGLAKFSQIQSHSQIKPIKDFKIIAFPDKSECNDWLKKATELNEFCFNVIVNEWLEKTNYEAGTDLADVFMIEKKKQIVNQSLLVPKRGVKFKKKTNIFTWLL